MFDEENLISLAIFLSFCLSVHNTFITYTFNHDYEAMYCFPKFVCFFRIIFIFSRNLFIIILRKFSHYFFRIYSRNFCIFYFAKISHFFAKQIEAKKAKFFAFSRANEMRKRSEMVANKNFFLFAGNPSLNPKSVYFIFENHYLIPSI